GLNCRNAAAGLMAGLKMASVGLLAARAAAGLKAASEASLLNGARSTAGLLNTCPGTLWPPKPANGNGKNPFLSKKPFLSDLSVTPAVAVGNVLGQLTETTGRETSTGQAVDVTTRVFLDTKEPPSES